MRSTAADQKKIASLEIEINALKGSFNEVALHGDQLKQSRCALENEISDLKSQLCDLQGRYNCRSKSDEYFLHCVNGISRCRKSVENIIDFFLSAVQGNFLDPTLLFSSSSRLGNLPVYLALAPK